MKRCPRCGETKPLEAFARKGPDGRQSYCRDCRRVYQRGRPRVLLAKRLVREAKKGPCADCGVEYPHYVMDFDHRPGAGKHANLSILVKRGASRESILAEIAKCDLVCANCHRARTYRRRQGAWTREDEVLAAVAQW
jgi:hypothetical protein